MRILSLATASTLWLSVSGVALSGTPGQDLEKALAEKAQASKARGGENQVIMQAAIDAIQDLPKNGPKVGATLPSFSLPNAAGKLVESDVIGKNKHLIITFYRGGWCPYCNLQLRALQNVLPEFKKRGAELVAISPETPDNTLSTTQKNQLEFAVLSDKDNAYARKLGLVFALPKDLIKIYQKFGIDLPKSNGLEKWELPLAATFVVNPKGVIVYSFVDTDYKKRANIDDIIAALPAEGKS